MIPTNKQFRNWSLPSKYSFVGLVIALISLAPIILGVKDWVMAVPDYASLAYNYGASEMTIYGAEGSNPENAVIIRGANTHEAGVKAEYYWIQRRYPGYEKHFQAVYDYPNAETDRKKFILFNEETGVKMEMEAGPSVTPRKYDVLHIRNWYGRTRKIHFDITPFFNKGSEPREEIEHTGPTIEDFWKAVESAKNKKKAE